MRNVQKLLSDVVLPILVSFSPNIRKGSLNMLALVCEGKNKVKHCCNLAAIASPVEVGTPGATEMDYVLEDGVSYLQIQLTR